jgi:2'-5' RNA ligase
MTMRQATGSPPGRQTLRLFFALWPGAALRKRIAAHQALWTWSQPARPTPASKLHLTLLFMDGVDPVRISDLLRIGADAARKWADFDLALDHAAVWRRGGIAHLAPQRPPEALLALHRALAERVELRHVPFDARPYSPHVTLGRRAERLVAPTDFAPLHWRVRGFVLVQSELGTGRYAVLGRWPHRGGESGTDR